MELSLSSIKRVLGPAALVTGLLAPGAALAAPRAAAAPTWVTYNAKTHTATIKIVAGYKVGGQDVNGGFSFNGGAKGALTLTVPVNTKVVATFSNPAQLPHSAEVVAYSSTPPASAPAPAFKGAESPNAMSGTMGTSKPFTFMANKAGKYLLICAVPGHASAGMWDLFVVSKTAKTATATLKK